MSNDNSVADASFADVLSRVEEQVKTSDSLKPLSKREREAVLLMLASKSSRESAELMGLKDSTVRNYLQRSYKKLGCANAQELKELLGAKNDVGFPKSLCADGLPLGQPTAAKAQGGHVNLLSAKLHEHIALHRREACDSKASMKPVPFMRLALIAVFSLAFGFAVGELQRGSDSILAMASLGIFFGSIAFTSLVDLVRQDRIPMPLLTAVCVTMLVCAAFSSVLSALCLGFVLATCLRAKTDGSKNLLLALPAIPALAIGLFGGRYVIESWKDALLYEAYALAVYGDTTTATALVPVLATLLMAAGIICLIADIVVFGSLSMLADFADDQSLEEKTRQYFASQGLGELESSVLVAILRGLSGMAIGKELCYSYGTVNNARAGAYKKLGIHSKQELRKLVEQQVMHVDGMDASIS